MIPMMLLRPEEEKKSSRLSPKSPGEVSHLHKVALLSGGSRPTCSHKEDPGAQQDVVPFAVDAPEADAKAAHHEQNGAEDGEQARRSN